MRHGGTLRSAAPAVAVALIALASVLGPPVAAQFPGENGGIAFVRRGDRTRHGDESSLRIVSPSGDRRTLADGFDSIDDSAWSPNGNRIVFDGERRGRISLWIVRADGSGLRRLDVVGTGPAWSPDGSRLAVMDEVPNPAGRRISQIFVTTLGGERSQVTTGRRHFDPSWSPIGDRIAFRSFTTIGGRRVPAIGTIRPDGTGRRILVAGEGIGTPDWSPDGERLLFARNVVTAISDDGKHDCRSERWTVESIRADDGSDRVEHVVSTEPRGEGPWSGGFADPGYAPDGSAIVAVEERDSQSDLACGGEDFEDALVTFGLDGSDYSYPLTIAPDVDHHEPAWRPIP